MNCELNTPRWPTHVLSIPLLTSPPCSLVAILIRLIAALSCLLHGYFPECYLARRFAPLDWKVCTPKSSAISATFASTIASISLRASLAKHFFTSYLHQSPDTSKYFPLLRRLSVIDFVKTSIEKNQGLASGCPCDIRTSSYRAV